MRKFLVTLVTGKRVLCYVAEDENFETEVEGDHVWDGDSLMTCHECAFCSASRHFEES